MHDCPNGQTGDNIDDGYGYPWLFYSERSQQLMCDIWQKIARRYCDEPTILGYELMNEPIATYFDDKEEINRLLEPLYKRLVGAIREVDKHHIILLGGAQWNSRFEMFGDWKFDNKIMYTCHRYGGDATKAAIQSFIDFRDRTGLPMYMGEIGHNTYEWQADFVRVMKENNIGEGDRSTYKLWREARPSQDKVKQLLKEFLHNCRFENCKPEEGYIRSMGTHPRPLPKGGE